jgi:peptidyl-prolyl cis-trans isomerase C
VAAGAGQGEAPPGGGVIFMKRAAYAVGSILLVLVLLILPAGCGKDEKPADTAAAPQQAQAPPAVPLPAATAGPEAPAAAATALPVPADVVVEVDGTRLTQGQIDAILKKRLASVKEKLTAEQKKKLRGDLRKRIIDDFVTRTLLANEIKRRNVKASEQEINEAIQQVKGTLQPGTTLEDLMKQSGTSQAQLREEIAFGVKLDKLVKSSMGKQGKPTDKEISAFYEKNKKTFTIPESVRARHILIAKATGDDEKVKAEKKAKAEDVRKQLLAGGNFMELAKKYSECPSKEHGGDLGEFPRGQMVKPFDQAAFSQKVNEIGPVVETDFGYHIIQVQEHNAVRPMPLEKVKDRVSLYLEHQKKNQALGALVKKLQTTAKIMLYKQP